MAQQETPHGYMVSDAQADGVASDEGIDRQHASWERSMRINPFENNRVPTVATCKCCGGTAHIVGVTDFSRCGTDMIAEVMATGQPLGPASIVTRKVEPYSGWPIYYYRCVGCLFTFTPAFDAWDHADFGRHVYNADYARHDPEYNDVRPRQYAGQSLTMGRASGCLNVTFSSKALRMSPVMTLIPMPDDHPTSMT
jgi:hypothetical protein